MKCPKCGGIMIYNKQKDILHCLSCFHKKLPKDRIKRLKIKGDEWLDENNLKRKMFVKR